MTLIELLVALAMVAILVAVALPSFRRDTAKNEFEDLVDHLAQDLQAARFQAISDKTLRDIHIYPPVPATAYYQLVVPAVAPVAIEALLRQQAINLEVVQIAGYTAGTVEATSAGPATSGDLRIRFSMIGDLQVCPLGVCAPGSVTIYLQTNDGRYRARLIVSRANGYTRRLEGW